MPDVNRRQFLGAASALALRPERILGANDRIGVAMIGCGERGLLKEVLQVAGAVNCEVVAVCDTWRQQREKAVAAVKAAGGRAPEPLVKWEDALALKGVDAVVIATPDHQHASQLTAAVRAGKDAYIEKPMAMHMKELLEAVDTVRKSGRVVQAGTQVRSWAPSVAARAFVQSGGLGKIYKVEQSRNGPLPYWHSYGRRPIAEADVDWNAFLFNKRPRPFSSVQYGGWYGFRDFSSGPHTNLAVHFFDLVHYVTGATQPKRVTTTGGHYRFKDEYEAPDSVEITLEYPDQGFLVRYNTTFGTGQNNFLKFFGTRGVLDGTRWNEPLVVTGEGAKDDRAKDGPLPVAETTHHMQNFFECVRSRKAPNAPIEAGYTHAVAAIMAEESYRRQRPVTFDATKRQIKEA
jgi:predicted dehydrogenase